MIPPVGTAWPPPAPSKDPSFLRAWLRAGSHDRDFAEWYQDQEDALEAWRKNFLAPRTSALPMFAASSP